MARKATLANQKATPRKTVSETWGGGRPPKNPMDKMSISVRAMVTPRVTDVLANLQKVHGFQEPPQGRVASDLLRLALFFYVRGAVEKNPDILGEYTWEQIANDPTWDSLKMSGLV